MTMMMRMMTTTIFMISESKSSHSDINMPKTNINNIIIRSDFLFNKFCIVMILNLILTTLSGSF